MVCSDKNSILWFSFHLTLATLEGSTWIRTKQGTWYKQIQLMKGSDFLIILSSQHFIGNTFTRTALRQLHQNCSVCFEGWNKFWVPVWSPLDPNLTRRWKFSFTEGESDFLPLPVFFFEVSSAIGDITLVLVIIHFLWARPVINQLWYLECHFSLHLGKVHVQMKIYERLLQVLLSLASRCFAAHAFLCGSLGSPK